MDGTDEAGVRAPGRWAHVRAAAIVLLVFVNLCQGAPRPRVSPESLAKPSKQRQLQDWAERLDLPPEELADRLVALTKNVDAVRTTLTDPFWIVLGHLGFNQRWPLFSSARGRYWRMQVERRTEAGDVVLVYRPGDPEHDWSFRRLEYRRVRGTWNPGTDDPRIDYLRFVDWVSHKVCAAFPDTTRVRVSQERFEPPRPGGPPHAVTEVDFVEERPCAR